ncbi:MAG: DsrE family protein [Pseudomonadales bacterium]|nr:DsrE family protein [Pseudomonadales bacterium]
MKSVLYLIRRRPNKLADETTDLILVSGVFEQPTSVLFTDDGVFQLVGLEGRQSSIKALPTYGVSELHVAVDSLERRDLSLDAIDIDVRLASAEVVRELIAGHDIVLND